MRILIVSRDLLDPSVLADLKAAWYNHDISIATTSDLSGDSFGGAELVAIIGAMSSTTEVSLEVLSTLTNAMVDPAMPVIAAGWGFELACAAIGDDLSDGYSRIDGAERLVPTSKGETLFQGSDPLRLNAGARWDYDDVPRGYAILARSETGVEAFQSKKQPLLALQPMPGDFTYPSDGKLVYQNALSAFGKLGKRN